MPSHSDEDWKCDLTVAYRSGESRLGIQPCGAREIGIGNTLVEIVTTIGPRQPPESLAYTLFAFPMCDRSLTSHRCRHWKTSCPRRW
jgi:hypothetical protein